MSARSRGNSNPCCWGWTGEWQDNSGRCTTWTASGDRSWNEGWRSDRWHVQAHELVGRESAAEAEPAAVAESNVVQGHCPIGRADTNRSGLMPGNDLVSQAVASLIREGKIPVAQRARGKLVIPDMPEGGVFAVVEPSSSSDRHPTAVDNACDSTAVAATGACTPRRSNRPGPKPPPPPCRILGKWQGGPPPGMPGMQPFPNAVLLTESEAVHVPKPPPSPVHSRDPGSVTRPIVQAPSASANPQAELAVPNFTVINAVSTRECH